MPLGQFFLELSQQSSTDHPLDQIKIEFINDGTYNVTIANETKIIDTDTLEAAIYLTELNLETFDTSGLCSMENLEPILGKIADITDN
ncbi:MAG: hypothetical protein K0Q51_527 [Rickettsiaceae bacterium]|jgi:hypothetical protein|nr:hypothetical protein [Rickettsiaceae bacterium]